MGAYRPVSHEVLAEAACPSSMAGRTICRHARRRNPREEPGALTCMPGSVRGGRGNLGPYRDPGAKATDKPPDPTAGAPPADSTCAVKRRFFLVGANPTQYLSFQLVAAKAIHGGNDMD